MSDIPERIGKTIGTVFFSEMRNIKTGSVKSENKTVTGERLGQIEQQVVFIALFFRDPDDLLLCVCKTDIFEMAGPPIAAVSLDIENLS